jgi:hypothetical protein
MDLDSQIRDLATKENMFINVSSLANRQQPGSANKSPEDMCTILSTLRPSNRSCTGMLPAISGEAKADGG